MGSQGSNVSSGGKLRLCSDSADAQTDLNLCCTHLLSCTLCLIPAVSLLFGIPVSSESVYIHKEIGLLQYIHVYFTVGNSL